jgi:hypothetical protein
MEPKDPQLPEKKPTDLADYRISRNTPFGPMSRFQSKPENRIVHKDIKKDK